MNDRDLKVFLDEKVVQYNTPEFIADDPILIPHRYNLKNDIEISGLLAATLAWGNRKSIIKNAEVLLERMDGEPSNFIRNSSTKDINSAVQGFCHRTFNEVDAAFFIKAISCVLKDYGGMEELFFEGFKKYDGSAMHALHHFREVFFSYHTPGRTSKHVSDPLKNSSSKRLCMYLRWMIRKDNKGVDLGIWETIDASDLMLPLDTHTGRISRALGLLKRKQNDWKAVEEVTARLRQYDPADPSKYDLALFGIGMYEDF